MTNPDGTVRPAYNSLKARPSSYALTATSRLQEFWGRGPKHQPRNKASTRGLTSLANASTVSSTVWPGRVWQEGDVLEAHVDHGSHLPGHIFGRAGPGERLDEIVRDQVGRGRGQGAVALRGDRLEFGRHFQPEGVNEAPVR